MREGRGSSAGPLRTSCGRFFLAGAPANGTLVPVSSMKTSCLVSIEGCLSRHSLRAALTSSRSCSAACSVSFKADPVTIEEAPQSRNAGREGFVRNQTPADSISVSFDCLATSASSQSLCASVAASAGHRRLGWPTSHQFAGSAAPSGLLILTLNTALAPRRDLPREIRRIDARHSFPANRGSARFAHLLNFGSLDNARFSVI